MLPRRLLPVLSFGFLVAAILGVACESQDDPCSSCDPESEYCVRYGSDVAGESATMSCAQLPAACSESPSCDCLASVDDSESNIDVSLSFCLMEGSCVEDDVLRIVCPGG
jgi:hypothetical protein